MGRLYLHRRQIGRLYLHRRQMGRLYLHRRQMGRLYLHRRQIGRLYLHRRQIGRLYLYRRQIGRLYLYRRQIGRLYLYRRQIGRLYLYRRQMGRLYKIYSRQESSARCPRLQVDDAHSDCDAARSLAPPLSLASLPFLASLSSSVRFCLIISFHASLLLHASLRWSRCGNAHP
jgi:hypothetical protein